MKEGVGMREVGMEQVMCEGTEGQEGNGAETGEGVGIREKEGKGRHQKGAGLREGAGARGFWGEEEGQIPAGEGPAPEERGRAGV